MAPTLADLRRRAEAMRSRELDAVRNKVDPQTFEEIDRVTRRLMNKFLHSPTVALKRSAVNGSAERMMREFRALFALDDERYS